MRKENKKNRTFGSYGKVAIKRKTIEKKRNPFVLYPDSKIVHVNALILLLILFYLITALPLDIAFSFSDQDTNHIWSSIDLAITIYFGIDILLNCFMAYKNIDDNFVVSVKDICKKDSI